MPFDNPTTIQPCPVALPPPHGAGEFAFLMGEWRTAFETLESKMGKLDSAIDAMPVDLREHWSTRPQYLDYGIDAAEREIDAASDKLNDVEKRLLEMPAPDLWAVEY